MSRIFASTEYFKFKEYFKQNDLKNAQLLQNRLIEPNSISTIWHIGIESQFRCFKKLSIFKSRLNKLLDNKKKSLFFIFYLQINSLKARSILI